MEQLDTRPDVPAPESLIRVGQIYRPHGVRGELKVAPETDDPARFTELSQVYVGRDVQHTTAHAVEGARFQETKRGITVILKLDGIDSRDDAEHVTKQQLFAAEAELPPLDEDEVFIHDLIGLDVVTEGGEAIGTVANVLTLPAHDTYVVRRPGKPEAMIPDVDDFIVALDLDDGRLVIRPIEGLLE